MAVLLIACLMIMAGFTAAASCSALVGRRRAEQSSLLWMLSLALDREFPLPDEIDAYADGFGLWRRDALHSLAEQLRSGARLDVALERGPRLVSPQALLAIQTGAAVGLLPQALRQEARRMAAPERLRRPLLDSLEGWFVYMLGAATVILTIVTFLTISIMPKFRKIFEDFGTSLPPVTVFAMNVADIAASFVVPAAGLGFLGAGYLIWQTFFSKTGWATFDPPIFRWGVRRFDTPVTLRACAMQVEAGKPLTDMLRILGLRLPRPSAAKAMKAAAERTADGNRSWAALNEAGFLTGAEAQALNAAENAGNLPWALRAVAEAIEGRWGARFASLRELLRPLIVLPLGVVVFLIMTAFFAPLVKLIADLS